MPVIPRTLRSTLATLAVLLPLGAALAQTPARATAPAAPAARPAFPALQLPDRVSRGQRAIDLLGDRLPEVAAFYRQSPDQFRQLLLRDGKLRLDQRGRLFVEETLERPLSFAATPQGSSGLVDGQLAPLEQTFLLHSKPGAARTIYLNFRGRTLSGTAWNGTAGNLTALPFDLDGLPYSYNQTELQRIQYIWQRVAEDFAPFDVNVTTEPPAPEAITRSASSDGTFGTEVLITQRSGVYNCSCGGVAYIGIFDDTSDYYKPALVFYDALGSGNEKYVAEAISHEAGHNMGLLHDGNASTGYYSGHGSGTTGWAPIMGVGYYQALVQWSRGEYAGANQTQDDFVVMQGNGLPLRADDHGNTPGAATPMAVVAAGGWANLSAQGVVERPSDVDVFSFTAGAGSASFTVTTAARSANLDAQLELRDAAGTLIASANPADGLTATLTVTLPATGVYHLTVQGVGKGDPLTTGYTDYGSLGQYALSGTVPISSAGLAPTASISAAPTRGTVPLTVSFSSAGSSDPDGSIVAYEWGFGDGSPAAAGAATSHTYTTAGSFTAQLKVTDNSGLTALRSVTITVDPVVAVLPMRVADIAMGLQTNKSRTRATAAVRVLDGNGQPVANASVSGRWTGLVSGTATVLTGSNGVATFASGWARSGGTFTFTVTGVSLSGHSYQPSLNTETSDSISF